MLIKNKTKRLVLSALYIALGVVLPIFFHFVPNAGPIFLPMHIPVLMAGLMLGPSYGLAVGIAAPLLSSLLTGMPPAPILPGMLCELAVYGLVAGILMKTVKTKNNILNIYISLVGAMLAGRIIGGIVKAFIFVAGDYSLQIWLTGSFITALPGIIIQLVLIPILLSVLEKTRLYD